MNAGSALWWVVTACLLSPALLDGEVLLRLDPGLKFSTEAGADRKPDTLTATLPLQYDRASGCVMEFDFTLAGLWYYAPLRVGVRSGDAGTEVGLWFEKTGGEAGECRLYVRRNGRETVAARWETVECAKYRLVLRWTRNGQVDFIARKGDGVVFTAACDGPSPLSPDAFFMRVQSGNDNGYIGYDCEDESLFMRSQPGDGAYVASAFIDFISLKSPASGAAK